MRSPAETTAPPEICFYVPEEHWLADMPRTTEEYWDKHESKRGAKHLGRYSWTVKTYLYLTKYGTRCNLTSELPKTGIVVAHRDFLAGIDRYSTTGILLVCIKADREALDVADIHILQNPSDQTPSCGRCRRTHFIHYWPQERLIPRDLGRKGLLRNVAYLGREWNLDPRLRQPWWSNTLKEMGLNWRIVPPDRWNDYREIDAIVAVRKLNTDDTFDNKPASKLVNSWRAGVPAILGCESAYRAERRSELDYLEARTVGDALNALNLLRSNKTLYHQMVINGRERAQELTCEEIAKEWKAFFEGVAVPQYYQKLEQLSDLQS
jgi:hypothetical protein